ncbi:uncharacterized protein EI97DRAFT_444907 [Westerdykella ornata]|uniref:Uncharacterized protein n=1 Tax=Westerdykella ornata TaxID=318751 RepID=A0A6A6JAN1_WESOR|nr:uncharacterized protein EI97DRAFT_444907 [Westerdykella ornata]KAF2273375.1 hypothetical protein EI97DRAFT_444907 [Westerdykella ornata]
MNRRESGTAGAGGADDLQVNKSPSSQHYFFRLFMFVPFSATHRWRTAISRCGSGGGPEWRRVRRWRGPLSADGDLLRSGEAAPAEGERRERTTVPLWIASTLGMHKDLASPKAVCGSKPYCGSNNAALGQRSNCCCSQNDPLKQASKQYSVLCTEYIEREIYQALSSVVDLLDLAHRLFSLTPLSSSSLPRLRHVALRPHSPPCWLGDAVHRSSPFHHITGHQMGPSRVQGRLHKRGTSAPTMIASPTALNPLPDSEAFLFKRSPTPSTTHEEPWNAPARPQPIHASSSSHHSNKTKLYLRKLSSGRDAHSLDLSRPAAENEGLAGLGITDYSPSVTSRARHTRSTSTNSHFSTSSSLRPTAPYMPPILPTPSSYTPPHTRSTPPSVLGHESDVDAIMADDELRLWQNTKRRSASIASSAPAVAPPLRIYTPSSSARNGESFSHSSASLVSPIAQARSRGDTLKSIDTATSPSSRTSFDKAFTFIRGGGRDSPVDPAARAASIRAARIAFQQKEEAKERKHDKEASKLAERQNQKLYKKEERQRRKSEHMDRPHYPASAADSYNEKSTPRPSIGGRQYSDAYHPHAETTLPVFVPTVRDSEKRGMRHPKVTGARAAKSRWIRFVTWFKTRILRISNRVHVRS